MKFNKWMIFCFVLVSILFTTLNCVLAQETLREALMRGYLDAQKERGMETNEKLESNYVELLGDIGYGKKTGSIFLGRVLGSFPPSPSRMDLFGDYRLTPEIQNFCYVKTWLYLNENYISNLETAVPSRFVLAKNSFLSDMLYWEWEADGIQFRKQETGSGMLLSIIPKELDVKKGISNQELKELLLKVTKIPSNEVNKMLSNSPSVLREGTVFSNVENLHELVEAKVPSNDWDRKFPIPRESGEWSRQLVGFISKNAIYLIIMHEVPIQQVVSFPPDPLIVCGSSRWLSGHILQKDGVTPVLPHGVKEIPKQWKPVLKHNAEDVERLRRQEEENRIEAAKWKIWYNKSDKPIHHGQKMKFEFWDKRPPYDSRYTDGTVTFAIQTGGYYTFPLGELNKSGYDYVISQPMKKLEFAMPDVIFEPTEKTVKKPEPKPEDIE
ncbi:MAG: hypothetical protein LBJ67_04320 [Planctomycetaceae bacterium]|jgi:hypothetical protein|nr:hypothetical protein [Planctomycetaceae bacterium]